MQWRKGSRHPQRTGHGESDRVMPEMKGSLITPTVTKNTISAAVHSKTQSDAMVVAEGAANTARCKEE